MFSGSTAGGLQPGPTTGNTATTGGSGGGSGDGLTQSEVQALIDSSLAGAVQPSSVTTTGTIKASGGLDFDASEFPDGSESSIVREQNGGMLLKRGGTTFLTLSPFSGANFGVNVTAGNLTVNGTFTPSGGISGMYSSAAVDALLAGKQSTITTGSLAISDVATLQSSLDGKQSLLSDRDGTGVTLRDGTVMRRVFGSNGVSVTVPLNIADANDPENFNLKIDGSSLQSSIAALQSTVAGKQDALTSSSSVDVGTLNVGNEVVALAVKAPSGDSIQLSNNGGFGLTVASNGAVGILKQTPTEALDVFGHAAISGTLTVGDSGTFAGALSTSGALTSSGGGYDPYNAGGRAVVNCVTAASGWQNAVGADFFFGSGSNATGSYGAQEWSLFANPFGDFDFYRLGSELKCLSLARSNGGLIVHTSLTNNSDASLKSPPVDASTEDALAMLKSVSARTYQRLDLPNEGSRLGFIAQEVESAIPDLWGSVIGRSRVSAGGRGSPEREIKTLDYARLVCVLWQCNRSMLARIESLEARLE